MSKRYHQKVHALAVDSIQAFQFHVENGLVVRQSRLRRPCESVMRHWENLLTMHPLIAYSYPLQTANHHHDKQDPIIFDVTGKKGFFFCTFIPTPSLCPFLHPGVGHNYGNYCTGAAGPKCTSGLPGHEFE